MDPVQTERQREFGKKIDAILQEVRIIKEYVLEIRKSQSQREKKLEQKEENK